MAENKWVGLEMFHPERSEVNFPPTYFQVLWAIFVGGFFQSYRDMLFEFLGVIQDGAP